MPAASSIVRTQTYDVIVGDLFHPARDGAGSLYTVEHFQAIRARLNPGACSASGCRCISLTCRCLQTIIRTFLQVFPEGSAVLAHYSLKMPIVGLVAGLTPLRYPADWLERRVRDDNLRTGLEAVRLQDSLAFFGNFLAGSESLRTFAGKDL